MFTPRPEPKTPLGRLRALSPTAAVKVSPLCLGAMNFGTAWEGYMGSMDKKTTMEILDYFYESGGNFIDTANNYQNEESETWIGEWMKERNNRGEMVIATKYTSPYNSYNKNVKIAGNYVGNSAKSLRESVEASLRKLQTDYIDVLYLHWWDHFTSIPEIMLSLNDLVRSGKVLYLGVSDTPAWIVSKANQYARDHGLRQFVVYQGKWNAATRDMERDILPMCLDEGMGVCPWQAVGGGKFKTEEEVKALEASGDKGRSNAFGGQTENDKKITAVLDKIAKSKGKSITAIALAYVLQYQPFVHPIVGGRKVSHLKDNIEALTVSLSDAELKEIVDAIQFDVGFPHDFIGRTPGQFFLLKLAGTFDHPLPQKAIGHH